MSLTRPLRWRALAHRPLALPPLYLCPARCIHQCGRRRQDDDTTSKPDPPSSTNASHEVSGSAASDSTLMPAGHPGSTAPANPQPPPSIDIDPSDSEHTRATAEDFPPYTVEEKEALAAKYTPEQLEAIEAGEASIDPQDLADQGVLRNDPMRLQYLDDLSARRAYVDHAEKEPEDSGFDPRLRYKEDDELAADVSAWVSKTAQQRANAVRAHREKMKAKGQKSDPRDEEGLGVDRADWARLEDSIALTAGKPGTETGGRDYEAPALPPLDHPAVRAMARASRRASQEDEANMAYEPLAKSTGLDVAWMRGLRVKELVSRRVVNQTRMGKVAKTSLLVVAGDGNGLLGLGEGKGVEIEDAKRQAVLNAIRNLTPIPRYERRTIFGDVKGKVGATELELFNRPPGFGIRCQAKIYEMCKCAGISDLAARVTRARNPMNTVKAAFEALRSQRDPEQVARARGKKMVDVRRVYYSGMV